MIQTSIDFEARASQRRDALRRIREIEHPFDLAEEENIFGTDQIVEREVEHVKKPVKEANPILKRETEFRHRTRDLYEKDGFIVADVGTWRQFWAGGTQNVRRSDLFGCIDMVAMKGSRWIGIQFTSKSNLGAHVTKMCSHVPASARDKTWRATHMRNWIKAGGEIHLIGWHKPGRLWEPEIRELTQQILDTHEPRTRKPKA